MFLTDNNSKERRRSLLGTTGKNVILFIRQNHNDLVSEFLLNNDRSFNYFIKQKINSNLTIVQCGQRYIARHKKQFEEFCVNKYLEGGIKSEE